MPRRQLAALPRLSLPLARLLALLLPLLLGGPVLAAPAPDPALAAAQKTVQAAEAKGGLALAQALRTLAGLFLDRGDPAAARPHLTRAVALVRAQKPLPDVLLAEVLLDEAAALHGLGLKDEAQARRGDILPLLDGVLARKDPAALDLLARLADATHDAAATRPLEARIEQAFALIPRPDPGLAAPDRQRALRVLSALGGLVSRLGNHALALQILTAAVHYVDPEPEAQAGELGLLSVRLGDAHFAQENLPKAKQFFTYAVDKLEPRLGKGHPAVGQLHQSLGLILFRLGEREAAWQHLQAARPTLDRVRQLLRDAPLPQSVKLAEHNRVFFSDELHFSLALQRALAQPAARADLVALLLRRKGAVLETVLPSADRRPTEAVRKLRTELQAASARLAAAWLQRVGQVPTAAERQRLADLERERDRLETELAAKSRDDRQARQEPTLQGLCAALPDRSALLEYVHTVDYTPIERGLRLTLKYVAVLVRKDGCRVEVRELGDAKPVRDEIHAFRRAIATSSGRGAAALEGGDADKPQPDRTRELGRKLYDLLVAPFAPEFKDLALLLVAPDDQLRFLPFAALVRPDGKLLIDDEVPMSQIGSGREVLRMHDLPPPVGSGALVLAAPDFGPAQARPASGPTRCTLRQGGWPDLPGTRQEAEAVRALLTAAKVPAVVRLGADATEQALRKDAPGKRFLTLATHGWFAPEACAAAQEVERDPLLLSGLVLSGANRAGTTGDDGWVTAAELASLDLQGAQVVVLSACETGLGQTRTAIGEGVFGLERALTQAGARGVVLSLWQVADAETAALMARFWQGVLQDQRPAWRALIDAQRGLRQELARQGRDDPALWAAFVYAGAWR